jgi:hypothetical protein
MCSLAPYIRRYIHGQRVIFPERIYGANDALEEVPNSMEVLDFSLAAVLSAKGIPIPMSASPPSSSQSKPGTLMPSSTIHAGEVPIFEGDVETHLPCVSYKRDLKQTYAAYMIHADGIVGVNVCSHPPLLCYSAPRKPRLAYGFHCSISRYRLQSVDLCL